MSIISAFVKLLKAIVKKIIKFIIAVIKKFWWVILIIAIIYFAPYLLTTMVEIGAPEFLCTAMEYIAVELSPLVVDAVAWAVDGVVSVAATAGTAFGEAGIIVQAATVIGSCFLIAPDETTELVSEVAAGVGELLGAAVSGVSSGLGLGSWLLWGLAAFAAYKLFNSAGQAPVDGNLAADDGDTTRPTGGAYA